VSSPIPDLGPQFVEFAVVASFMVATNLYFLTRLFPRGGGTPTFAQAILVLGLFVMTTGLWFAVIYAILSPGDASTVSVFIAGNSMMAVFGAWLIGLFYGSEERRLPATRWGWPAGLALLLVSNELLMGIAYVLAQTGSAPYAALGWPGLLRLATDAADSIWFFWAMLANMVVLVLWVPLPAAVRTALLAFAGTAAVGPWVVPDPVVGALGTGIVMAATVGLVLRELQRTEKPSIGYLRAAFAIAGAFAAMSVAQAFLWLDPAGRWSSTPFAFVNLAVMFGEVAILARWSFSGGPKPSEGSSALVPQPSPSPVRADS
jgi:hypothetical protein